LSFRLFVSSIVLPFGPITHFCLIIVRVHSNATLAFSFSSKQHAILDN